MIQFQKILKFFSSCQIHQSQEGDPVTYELVNFMSLTKNLLKEMGCYFQQITDFFCLESFLPMAIPSFYSDELPFIIQHTQLNHRPTAFCQGGHVTQAGQ